MIFRQLCCLLSIGLAAGQELKNVAITAIGEDGQAVVAGSKLQGLDITFTTYTAGATTATIELPSGLITATGSVNLTFTAPGGTTVTYTTTTVTTTTYLSDESDENSTTAAPTRRMSTYDRYYSSRRLSGSCVVTGASISGTTMTLDLAGSGPGGACQSGDTVSTSVTADSGGSATFNNAPAGTINFQISTDTDSVVIPISLSPDGSGGFTVSVVGDPITWYGGKKIKFWFPNYKLMPLLKTPELTVWASTFEGPSQDYQWFERFAGPQVTAASVWFLVLVSC